MIGAIIGDMVGSVYEFCPTRRTDFEAWTLDSNFTDDSVLTVATADAILRCEDYPEAYRRWPHWFPAESFDPNAGYGDSFMRWYRAEPGRTFEGEGNGSAMRISPVGWAFGTLEETLTEAKRSARCSHGSVEGIKGAQAVAAAIFWARNGESKDFIRRSLEKTFGYDMSRTCDEIRPGYSFTATSAGTVPPALTAFLDAKNFEEAVRLAVAFGGDADTMGSVAGGVAEAFWGVESIPATWRAEYAKRLDLRLKAVVDEFNARFRPGVSAAFSGE